MHPWGDDSVVLSVENIDFELPKAPSPKLRPRACCMRYSLCVMIACLVLALCGGAWQILPPAMSSTRGLNPRLLSSAESYGLTDISRRVIYTHSEPSFLESSGFL